MENLESIKNTIKNLGNKTIVNGCTEAEVNSAMTMIDKLLRVYNLSIDEVYIEQSTYVKYEIATDNKNAKAINSCVLGIAAFCDCKCWRSWSNNKTTYCFFGTDTDIALAHYLYQVIDCSIFTETNKFKVSETYLNRKGHGRGLVSSFQKGMVGRIYQRLVGMAQQRNADEGQKINVTGTSLIVLKNQKLESEFEKMGVKLKSANSNARISNYSAYTQGSVAGERVNLNRPLPGNRVAGHLT